MKKMILSMLLVPFFSSAQIVEPFFMENYFEEHVSDPISGIYHFCKSNVAEYNNKMKDEKKTHIYLVYRSKRDAYLEVLDYINNN